MKKDEIVEILNSESTDIFKKADETRKKYVGDSVHLRGLIEFSNICKRQCLYCGLRSPNQKIERYRILADEILSYARHAVKLGYKTIVLQSGEDDYYDTDKMCAIIRDIKKLDVGAGNYALIYLDEIADKKNMVWKSDIHSFIVDEPVFQKNIQLSFVAGRCYAWKDSPIIIAKIFELSENEKRELAQIQIDNVTIKKYTIPIELENLDNQIEIEFLYDNFISTSVTLCPSLIAFAHVRSMLL